MKRRDYTYIWQYPQWPALQYDLSRLAAPLGTVSQKQGHLLGRLADIGVALRNEALLKAVCEDVIGSSKIEGEILQPGSVRSSVARRLGVDIGAIAPSDRQTDGMVDMMLDATLNCQKPLTQKRLFGWHAALFPTGYSGLSRIRVGRWRDDSLGPMQVVSGRVGRQTVHFEAPPAHDVASHMRHFLHWVNAEAQTPPILKAGIGHLWFLTIHPFEDGNGRIARAIGDLLLARADGNPQRFFSLSAQIERSRSSYYDTLEQTQRGNLDITEWLIWFLDAMQSAIEQADATVDAVLQKRRFWQRWQGVAFNTRQLKVLNRVLDGFQGNLTSRRWASMAPCSPDTALRDINELIALGVLQKANGGGRSSAYVLCADSPAE